jgi:tRNA G18 (ribose-2'-O)-methylase SpoU
VGIPTATKSRVRGISFLCDTGFSTVVDARFAARIAVKSPAKPTSAVYVPSSYFLVLSSHLFLDLTPRGARFRLDPRTVVNDLKDRLAAESREQRRARRKAEYRAGLRPFAIAAWEISKEHNVGSLVRTAHAAAAEEVLLVGERDWNVEAARTAELYTRVVQLMGMDEFQAHIQRRGWSLVAVELHARAISLFDASYPERPCFLLGAELGGVPEPLIEGSSLVVQIPQWGLVPSLNLAIAGSIVVYDYLAKLHVRGKLDRPAGGLHT